MTSRASSLCSGALLLFAFKIAPNQGKVFLIHLFEEITSAIKRDLDSTLPGQQATECATTADVADIFILCKNVAAKHKTPDLLPCFAELNWEAINATRLRHENQLR